MSQPTLKELTNQKPTETVVETPVIAEVETTPELVVPVVEPIVETKPKGRPAKQVETPEVTTTLETILNNPNETEEVEELTFWSDVAKLSGEELDIDFGNVDPISPEGAVLYAKTFRDKGIEEFEQSLATNYPKEYQALILRMEGKDPSIIYTEDSFDYKTLKIDEDDEDTQKAILRQDLKAQGLSDKRVDVMVKSIYDTGDLYTEAQDSLARLKKNQEEAYQQELHQIEQYKAQQQQEINSFSSIVSEVVTKGQIGDFVINDKDKKGFYDFLANNVKYEDGNFYAIVPLEKDVNALSKQLQTEYFRYKNGNLKDIVVKQAITENAKRLRANIKEGSQIGGGVMKHHDDKPTWNQELKSKLRLGNRE